MDRITVIDEPDQQFSIILNRRRVSFRLWYNSTSDRWSFDMAIDDLPVLTARKIVTGVDLLEPFDFGVGAIFALVVTPDSVPDRDGLPAGRVRLYHATAEEIEAARAA